MNRLPRLPWSALLLAPLFVLPTAHAAKLVEVRPVDEQVLMVYFKDGEVFYRDTGAGANAFMGHEAAAGDARLEAYGDPLATDVAGRTTSWTIRSSDDERYRAGLAPVAVNRKSKVTNTDDHWNYKLDHWMFLRLPQALRAGAHYTLEVARATHADRQRVELAYDYESSESEAIHVNLIGYRPDSPVKAADLYLWLGDGGQRDYSSFVGREFWLYDVATHERFPAGRVAFWRKATSHDVAGRNLTGSDVWTVDFSAFHRPGRYRLVVDGVGCSAEFAIDEQVWYQPYRTSLRGYYYMRIGEPRDAANPPPRQPRFIAGEDPAGFTIYLTDLQPYDPWWKAQKSDVWDEPHFKPARTSKFWQRRLPGNPTTTIARGGHSDALDWDRHLGHVSNIYDLLLPYVLTAGKLGDDNLGIRESGNGIPDLIDEARNEVDLWLSLRVGEAYAHGLTNPTQEMTVMFQAGTTTMAAWANAANCAMIADAFRVAGKPELMAHYRDEAVEAYRFASRQPNQQLDDTQEIGDAVMRGRDFRQMAAAFLYNVTGEREWEDVFAADCVARDGIAEIEADGKWVQTWASAAYLLCPQPRHYPAVEANLRASIRRQAVERNVRLTDERPSRRATANREWQTPENLQLVVLAHAFADNPADRLWFERAMVLEADWGLGRNPMNRVEMTGLGSRCIDNCYTSGRNDGVPGLHPGHTPYDNIDPWGTDNNGSNPRWFTARGYPDWDAGGWPYQEAYFNCRYCWSNGEFTPRQTMRGKMVLLAYLEALSR